MYDKGSYDVCSQKHRLARPAGRAVIKQYSAGFGAAQQPLLPPLARTGRGKAGVIARGGVTALVLMVALSPA